MWIKHLNVNNCRLLKNVSIEFSPKFNLIYGENASGKTSLIESIALLSKGRSFRTTHISDVVSQEQTSILLSATIKTLKGQNQIGIEKAQKKTKIRINKQDVYSQAELSAHLPVTIIHPASIDLIIGSPSLRRSYMDWIAFYLFDDFHQCWKEYQHILKQRNICLKDSNHRYALEKWTEELILLQPKISNYRKEVLENLVPHIQHISKILLSTKNIELVYQNGLPADQKMHFEHLKEFYKEKEHYDLKIKRTSAGAHRANFKVHIDNKPAIEFASRGQLKLLTISLLLAQSQAIKNTNKEEGILLIDDLAAELDNENKQKLIDYIFKLEQQIIVTSTQKLKIENNDHKMFHVKHGQISEVS